MNMEIIIIIVTAFISILLGINAFFIKGLMKELTDMKIKLAVLINTEKNNERRIETLEEEMKGTKEDIHSLELELGDGS